MPHRLLLGEKGLDAGIIEYKYRRDADSQELTLDNIIRLLQEKLTHG